MPHKRAKRSVREQLKSSRIADQAPTSSNTNINDEGIPKSISRVLNATQIRSEWKANAAKRKREDDSAPGASKKQKTGIAIQPGESLAKFNRRVEDGMRPLLNSAIQSSARTKVKTPKKQPTAPTPPPAPEPKRNTPSEFTKRTTSAPRRLNDIVQAPPQINKLPRGAARAQKKREDAGETSNSNAVSMKQKMMMEREREDAIRRYRELKERRLKTAGASEG